MRESEELDSRQLGKLQNRSQVKAERTLRCMLVSACLVKVVEIGTGPTGKRLLVTDDTGHALNASFPELLCRRLFSAVCESCQSHAET